MIKILTAREMHAIVVATGARPRPLDDPLQYEWAQARWMEQFSLNGAAPYRALGHHPRARIDGGSWLVTCICGNAPATDPEWRTACCFTCGAIYAGVEFPEDWPTLERIMRARPNPATRHTTTPNGFGARVEHDASWLRAENLAYGVAAEAED